MKTTNRNLFGLALVADLTSSIASGAVSIDWGTVGNPGNAADSTGYGAVSYDYQIAKNETTIGQYAAFLTAKAQSDDYGLYSTNMTLSYINGISRSGSPGGYTYGVNPGSGNKPITYTSWFDAARFCNWLHNGQGNGSTETGAYTLSGAMSGIVQKNADAKFWIPTENEWYKAAYYDPTKDKEYRRLVRRSLLDLRSFSEGGGEDGRRSIFFGNLGSFACSGGFNGLPIPP